MKSVIIDKQIERFEVKRSGIVADGQNIPFRLMDLLIISHPMDLSTKSLLALGKEGVSLLIASKDNRYFSMVLPLRAKNSDLKMAQYRSITQNRLGFAKYFLEEKIKSHATHLQSCAIDVEIAAWMEKIQSSESVEVLLGIEGSFSRFYFRHYFSLLPKALHRGKRSKRPPLDPVNSILSYLYTLLYFLVSARLYGNGFDPALGYLHVPHRDHNSLSSDFLELFRAKANIQAMEWFSDGVLEAEDFTKNKGVWLRYESRKNLWPAIKLFLDSVVPSLDDEIALLRSAIS